MNREKWRPVEVKGEVVHFPKGNPFFPDFKSPAEKEFWEEHQLELRTAMGWTSPIDHQPVVSPFIRLLPQKPPPDTSGRVLTMAAVALLLGIPSAREARKFLRRNGLKPRKVGRKFFIGKGAVEDFILGQQDEPTPSAVYTRADTEADIAGAAGRALDAHAPRRLSHAAK